MVHDIRSSAPSHPKISGIELTSDTLTSRAGMLLFARYIDKIGLVRFTDRWFTNVRKSGKGASASECLRQILLFFIDGTSRTSLDLTTSSRTLDTQPLSSGALKI